MKYKAKVSFGGNVSMHVGEIKEIADVNIAKDLLRVGYIEEIKPTEKAKPKTTKTEKGA